MTLIGFCLSPLSLCPLPDQDVISRDMVLPSLHSQISSWGYIQFQLNTHKIHAPFLQRCRIYLLFQAARQYAERILKSKENILLYSAICSHALPDLSFFLSYLSSFPNSPSMYMTIFLYHASWPESWIHVKDLFQKSAALIILFLSSNNLRRCHTFVVSVFLAQIKRWWNLWMISYFFPSCLLDEFCIYATGYT